MLGSSLVERFLPWQDSRAALGLAVPIALLWVTLALVLLWVYFSFRYHAQHRADKPHTLQARQNTADNDNTMSNSKQHRKQSYSSDMSSDGVGLFRGSVFRGHTDETIGFALHKSHWPNKIQTVYPVYVLPPVPARQNTSITMQDNITLGIHVSPRSGNRACTLFGS